MEGDEVVLAVAKVLAKDGVIAFSLAIFDRKPFYPVVVGQLRGVIPKEDDSHEL